MQEYSKFYKDTPTHKLSKKKYDLLKVQMMVDFASYSNILIQEKV